MLDRILLSVVPLIISDILSCSCAMEGDPQF